MSRPAVECPERLSPTVGHGGVTLVHLYQSWLIACGFPIAAGVILFGWRAGLVVAGVVISAMTGGALLGLLRGSGGMSAGMALGVNAVLLAMMLPAELGGGVFEEVNWPSDGPAPLWPLIPAAGLLLALVSRAVRAGTGRVHPFAPCLLMLILLAGAALSPNRVLSRSDLLVGDLLEASPTSVTDPWTARRGESPAQQLDWPAQTLWEHTSGMTPPQRAFITIDTVIRDRLPPLEDIVIGGAPAPIGMGSGIMLIVGGLFLIWRGAADWRVPLVTLASAATALLVLPVPVVIAETGAQYLWLMPVNRGGWAIAITLYAYELLGSPLPLIAMYVATLPTIRPTHRPGRILYAILLGLLAAALQRYLTVSAGATIALLMVSLLTPWIDRR